MRVENLKKQESVVESVLFTMGQSVEIRQLAAALESDEETAIQAVERLKEKYDKRKAGMQIVRLDDSYQMCSRTDYYEHLIRVAATPKKQVLSDVVMETLAIIAYTEEFLRRFGVGSTEQLPEMNVEQREEIRSEVEEELNLKIDEEGHLIDEPEKDAGTAEEPVDSETGMEKTEENESGAIISDTEIEKEIESEDNSETDEEDSIS